MKQSLELSITHHHDIYTNDLKQFKRVFLLLHGYSLDGDFMMSKLSHIFPENSLIIAPNGPFLIPVKMKSKDEFQAKFAWYFFDPYKKSFYINYLPGAHYIKNILEHYNPQAMPVTIIGYSQGGYIAPKVAEIVKSVDSVIGLACVFRHNKFTYQPSVKYHQVHGEIDSIVELSGAQEEFNFLKEQGNTGNFILLPQTGHRLQLEYINELSKIIQEKI